MKIVISTGARKIELEVHNDLTIKELQELASFPSHYIFFLGKTILFEKRRLSDYGITGNKIVRILAFSNEINATNGSHICPYGCGWEIPDNYKGWTELLRDQPNYSDY